MPTTTTAPTPTGGASLAGHAFATVIHPIAHNVQADIETDDIIQGKWAAGDQLIVNRVIFSVEWDRATAQYMRYYVYSFDQSIQKYGVRPALIIQSKGIGGCGGGANLGALDQRALNIGIRFADPPAQLELTVLYIHHNLEPGDQVTVTCPFIPNIITGARGLAGEVFEIVAINYAYATAGLVTLTLLDIEAITVPSNPTVVNPPLPVPAP